MTNDKYYIMSWVLVGVTFILLINSIYFMIVSKDLTNEVRSQKEYIKELEWENENNYMYCEVK